MSPRDERRRPPAGKRRPSLAPQLDDAMMPRRVARAEEAAWRDYDVIRRASAIVEYEAIRQDALRGLSDEQLDSLIWIGLLDDGWSTVVEEMTRREGGDAR